MANNAGYPAPIDVRSAAGTATRFFTSFFTAETRRRIEEAHAHLHPDQTYHADATVGRHWSWSSTCRSGATGEIRGIAIVDLLDDQQITALTALALEPRR